MHGFCAVIHTKYAVTDAAQLPVAHTPGDDSLSDVLLVCRPALGAAVGVWKPRVADVNNARVADVNNAKCTQSVTQPSHPTSSRSAVST